MSQCIPNSARSNSDIFGINERFADRPRDVLRMFTWDQLYNSAPEVSELCAES